ncbi:MAG: Maf family protein [Pseudomonadota bacterium]
MSKAKIYLASQSPRRRELLAQIGVDCEVIVPDVPEELHPGEAPEEYVIRLALAKARAVRERLGAAARYPVLAADTAVVLEHEIFGKPRDRADGLRMLARLSGRAHLVLTGMALVGETEQTRLSVSHVYFRAITAQEAAAYWASGEPQDKAGGYAIQGRAAAFIERLEGSYSGVMGLSLFEVAEMLHACGISVVAQE